MATLTRSQVQERNRQKVLGVARGSFLHDGYLATSLAAVAKDAGFTTGIVYSSFGSKADLALSVAEDVQTEQIDALGDRLRGVVSPDEVLEHVRAWAVQANESGWVRFELELLLDTIGDIRLAAAQTARQSAAVNQAAKVVRSLVRINAVDADTLEILAEAAVDYAIGVAIRQVTNRDASPDRFLRLIGPLVASLGSA